LSTAFKLPNGVKTLGLKQQTGFRADKDLLNRFRSKLALEGRDMGKALEEFIGVYLAGGSAGSEALAEGAISPEEQPRSETEWEMVHDVLSLIRAGGESAHFLRATTKTLLRLNTLEAALGGEIGIEQSQTRPYEAHPQNRARTPVTDQRIAEAQHVASELNQAATEARGARAEHPSNESGFERRGKRLGG
jgi:hypothetical protein